MFDLRKPCGVFFLVLGATLVVTGVATDYRPRLSDVNINLYAGLVMGAFGAAMLLWSRAGKV